MVGINPNCHPGGKGAHYECPATVDRPRAGITAHIRYIHHPQPRPGESLTAVRVRCACPCHKAPRTPPPAGQVDTPT